MTRPRVAFLVSPPLRAWAARAVDLAAASGAAGEVLVLGLAEERMPRSGVLALYAELDRRLLGGAPDAFAPAERDVETVATRALAGLLRARRVDVVVNLSARALAPAELALPDGAELWELRHGGLPAGAPDALLREFANGSTPGSTLIRRRTAAEDEVLYASVSAAHRVSLHRTRNPVYWKGATFVERALRLRAGGARQPSTPERGPVPASGAARALWSLPLRLPRRLLGLADELALHTWSWSIVWEEARDPEPGEPFVPTGELRPPRGRFYADPFVATDAGRRYVFFEDYPRSTRRGTIAVAELGAEGAGPPRPVLERDCHLSYPFVFRHGGEHFLVPESAEAGVVELLRATRFPYEWTREATLLEDVRAYDATLVRRDGRWFLFAAMPAEGAEPDELHVFWADELRGPYRPHPLNPVVSDVTRARPAGRIELAGGRLLRPGQDCSRGYGTAINLAEIVELTPETYHERPCGRLEPSWDASARGTHTLESAAGLRVMDVKRLRPRVGLTRRRARAGGRGAARGRGRGRATTRYGDAAAGG